MNPKSLPRASGTKGTRDWYRIQNKADEDGPAEVYIYDEIGESFWGGIGANQFSKDLAEITTDEITVHINSPGGFAYDGIAILNALRGHPAKITTIVDGLAASAASMIAMAGETVVMNRNSQMMIHDPNGVCVGNPKDMADYASYLDKMGENIASIYAERAGGENAEWRTAMQAETWYSAEEAVDAGLADRVEGTDADADKATNKFDLTIFNYAGRRAAPTPATLASRPKNSSATEAGDAGKEGTVPTLKEGLAERFGFDADADDDTEIGHGQNESSGADEVTNIRESDAYKGLEGF